MFFVTLLNRFYWISSATLGGLVGILVVYCLKNVDIFAGNHGLPEAVSIVVTVVLHLWRRNMLISIAGGTICAICC